MRRLIAGALILIVVTGHAFASDATDATKLLKETIEEVINVLGKEEADEQKKERVKEIVSPLFDFSLMAKLSLGKKAWLELKKDEQTRFTELFVKRIKDSYLEKMTRYTNEEVLFEEPTQEDKRIQVPTVLISKGNRFSMVYKLYRANDGIKIYDVEVQGVSLVKSYRSQFEAVLKNGTIDNLMQKLNETEMN